MTRCSGKAPLNVGGRRLSTRLIDRFYFFSCVAMAACAVNYNGASIREVADNVMVHGEGPFWDSENNVLYFVDISEHRVYRLFQNRLDHVQLGTYKDDNLAGWKIKHESHVHIVKFAVSDEDVSFVIPVAGQQGLFVVGLGTTLASLRWNLNESTKNVVGLATVDQNKVGNRFNDAKADINGYLWAGMWSMRFNYVVVYNVQFDNSLL